MTCCVVVIVQRLQSAPPSTHGTVEAFAAEVESGVQRRGLSVGALDSTT